MFDKKTIVKVDRAADNTVRSVYLDDGARVPRSTVVHGVNHGVAYETLSSDGSRADVHVVEGKNGLHISTDPNDTERDNLGDL